MDSDTRIYYSKVHQDRLSYYGTQLQVNGQPRCSSERLYDLVTWKDPPPLLTKAGKPCAQQPPPHKDEEAEFYHAQCIHYGLKAPKTREAAKKVLLEALNANQRKLAVPPSIVKLELTFELFKTEFEAANKTVKTPLGEQKKQRVSEVKVPQPKRKRGDGELLDDKGCPAKKRNKKDSKSFPF